MAHFGKRQTQKMPFAVLKQKEKKTKMTQYSKMILITCFIIFYVYLLHITH